MSETYPLNAKVYRAGGEAYSMVDLLHSFADPELQVNGMPRISDFHLKVGEPVRYRFDDALEPIPDGEPLTTEAAEKLIYPMLRPEHIERLRASRYVDIDAGFEWAERQINFRLNVFRDREGIAAVVRMLPTHIPELSMLGFPNDHVWQEIADLRAGLVLVTGVTNSGKSTTIGSILNHINHHRKVRIITLEDPTEYVFESREALISQRELGVHIETFHSGLRSALRENPDIIYIGEIRDLETAQLALTAAETGHLVFSTLHTRDAKGSLSRLSDMFPSERSKELSVQLSFSLAYVLSQKLLPRLGGNGRVVAMEVLKNIPSVGNVIRTGNWHQLYSSIETSSREGMNTLEQHLIALYEDGIISREDAISHANDANIIEHLPPPPGENKKRKRA